MISTLLLLAERFQQQVHITNRQQIQEPNFHPKRKQLAPSPQREPEDQEYEEYEEEEEEEEEEYEDGEKISYTSSTTPHSRCSRGVSTDELEDHETQTQPQPQKNPTEQYSTLNDSSSAASTVSDKANQGKRFQDGTDPVANQSKRFQDGTDPVPNQSKRFDRGEPVAKTNSKRFEDGDPVGNESAQTRNSVLLQLIACGSSAVGKAKNGSGAVKKCDSLHKGVLCKSAVKVTEEDYLIRYMSENPRFGNLQSEEKEYFSGSIVESMSSHEDRPVGTDQPVLKKSNSYNEERLVIHILIIVYWFGP